MRLQVAVFLAFVAVVSAQKGIDCSEDSECEEHQSCSFGYCKCSHGFVKIGESCYRDGLKHGEECKDDIQCSSDHRLGCKVQRDGPMACQCIKHYEYDENLKECVNARNLTEILILMQEQWKSYDRLDSEAKKVFVGLVSAGLLSIVLGVIFAGGCIIYGCCIPRWKMVQFQDEDFQTIPLCRMVHEDTVPPTCGEPPTPVSQPPTLDETSDLKNTSSPADELV
ncbi:uncharacterized protein LOC124153801 [Ischnura elegans]|uniref:uncharacterized protein LOC124153801 n=1 Tax=Ischnura elegans TaxID=197161 RepID=UPI001ED89D71|nr:uncharacterized protein LOC124153801 [Ischnura elegans]